jgi:hypothetical protein
LPEMVGKTMVTVTGVAVRARKQDPCDFETGWGDPMRVEPGRQR